MTKPGKQIRALRGATTIDCDETQQILDATKELLTELLSRNGITRDDVVSAFFTVTPDIREEFPARGARELGWGEVAMLCSVEMAVPGSLDLCIRVMLHVDMEVGTVVTHVYLKGAADLRPDLRTER